MKPVLFDTILERRHTDCSKWDAVPYDIHAEDMIPMWVADMDFACPPAVINAIEERLSHPVFGYSQFPESYWDSIICWHQTRYHSVIKREEIIPISSVLGGVAMAIQGLTERGDRILVPTPGYHAFHNSIVNNQRELVISPMLRDGDHYELDFPLLERQLEEENIKMVLFCSPHNPTGRIWTAEELSRLAGLCYRRRVPLVCDEIHADMTLTHPFTTVFSSCPHAAEVAIALYAPTKSFNIAGLCTAYAVIKNPALAEGFQAAVAASGLKVKNTLGVCALTGAYEHGGEWLDSLQEYLLDNARFGADYINRYIPGAHAYVPEATYFLWIDFTGTHLTQEEIIEKCVFKAHVAVTRGTDFIQGGEAAVRLNYACPRSMLAEALERFKELFTS